MWSTKKVDTGSFTSLAISKTDVPWVAYYNASSQSVKCSQLYQWGWQKQVIEQVGSADNTFCVSMALNDQGIHSLLIAARISLKLATSKNDKWTSATLTQPLGAVCTARWPYNPNGSPAISYFDKSSRHLKYAYTNGAACSLWM